MIDAQVGKIITTINSAIKHRTMLLNETFLFQPLKEALSPIAPAPVIIGGSGDSVFRVPTAAPPKATTTRQLSPNSQADQNLLQQIKFHVS